MDHVDLYWLPVGAGTHFQRASLVFYEALAAVVSRRPRAALYHTALKIGLDGRTYTLELTPVPGQQAVAPLLTGAVGSPAAGRLRLFRYQLCYRECSTLPDEEWAVGPAQRLVVDAPTIRLLVSIAAKVPPYTWGRRVAGTSEMWTSNSTISWLLTRAGVLASAIALPAGGRAPGWNAGVEAAAVRTP